MGIYSVLTAVPVLQVSYFRHLRRGSSPASLRHFLEFLVFGGLLLLFVAAITLNCPRATRAIWSRFSEDRS